MAGNGKPPEMPPGLEGVSPEDQAKMLALVEEQMAAGMLPLLIGAVPHAKPAKASAIARAMIRQHQEQQFEPMIADAFDPAKRAEYPDWGYSVTKNGQACGTVRIPKDTSKLNAEQAVQYATLLGMITSPTPRALLYVMGYELHFHQWRSSPIVT